MENYENIENTEDVRFESPSSKNKIKPEKNKKDVEEIPEDVRDRMHIVFVKHADEVLKHALMK